MAELSLRRVNKSFGATPVLKDIDLQVADGEFVVFVGPSGCGKSTLLRIIAGLEEMTSGSVFIGGADVSNKPPAQRGIAMVFQTYALYPHKNVYENMAYGLKLAARPKAQIRESVLRVARILELEPYLHRRPSELSGGQRQRVAIGRAIVRDPKVFLFDEPLSNLDAALRGQMRIEIADLHSRLNATMVYVTHDQVEAMTMADRIVVINSGRIEQQGAPLDLYHNPANIFVASFLGAPKMNLLPGKCIECDESGVTIDAVGIGLLHVPVDGALLKAEDTVTLGIRPQSIGLRAARSAFDVVIKAVEPLGGQTIIYGNMLEGASPVVIALDGDQLLKPRSTSRFFFDPAECHLFGPSGASCKRRGSGARRIQSGMAPIWTSPN
jgi:ABC-type sugar transport system ATPase subunit